MISALLSNIWLVFLDTAFWLLLGLLAAGVIKSCISEDTMKRWVGGRGLRSILRAALFGAPLPLCSCGVLPAAVGMRRAGASKEATVSFLISTPETSLDSVLVTYALMGPVMAVFRPVAALVNAVGTGLLTTLVPDNTVNNTEPAEASGNSCCSSQTNKANSGEGDPPGCCNAEQQAKPGRLMQIMAYAGAELLDDLSKWLAFGIILAGVMMTFIPPDWMAQWGGGLSAMLVMLVVGVPMYICAVASTPVAAGLLIAGVSPGAVLVFLLVGPATNITSFMVLKQQLGLAVTAVYLFGLSFFSVLMGLLLEWLLQAQQWQLESNMGQAHALLPVWLSWGSAFLLLFLAVKPLRRRLFPQLG